MDQEKKLLTGVFLFIEQFWLSTIVIGMTLLWSATAQAVVINDGAGQVNTPDVQLTLNLPQNCYQVQVQNEEQSSVVFSTPTATIPWTLSPSEGPKTVTVTYFYTYTYTYQCGTEQCGTYCCHYSIWGSCDSYCPTYCPKYCQGQMSSSSSESAQVILDQTPPTLTLPTLVDGSYTNNPILNLNGTASDLSGISNLTVAGTPVDVGTFGIFLTTVQLQTGSNVITAVASDNAGNTLTISRTITYDNQPPILSVTEPVQDGDTTQSSMTVKGEVSDSSGVTVTIQVGDGIYSPSVTNGRYEQLISFPTKSTYVITVTATDAADNASVINRTMAYINLTGDVDGDGSLTMADVIIALQVMSGMTSAEVNLGADFNEDGRIGMAEVSYIFRKITDPAVSQITPYVIDANTVLLDHFDGDTGASILAYSETGAACGLEKPSAVPDFSYSSGPDGLNQALTLNPPVGEPEGSATYLKFPGGQLLSQPNGTIEFWTYLTSYAAGVSLVNQGPFPGSCSGWTFSMSVNASGQIQAGAWAAFNMNSGTTQVPLNTWIHVAATWGSTGARLYLDGALVGSDTNTGMPASGYGGSVMVNYNSPAGTQINELRISNVQRTIF